MWTPRDALSGPRRLRRGALVKLGHTIGQVVESSQTHVTLRLADLNTTVILPLSDVRGRRRRLSYRERLVWSRLFELVADGMTFERAEQQADAEYNHGILDGSGFI